MTRDELVERQQAFHRASQGWTAPIFLPMIALLGAGSFRGIDFDRWGNWLEVAAFAALAVTLAIATIVVPRLQERKVQKSGLACPSCGEALIGTTGQIAVVTGRCGACGHRVVEPD
jgi:cytochrome bd-type quinol oxidase subunit 2